MPIHIVLVEPEIPQNTGNIVRTCAATGAMLHLVEPLGFSMNEKHLKRAGLDYWQYANISIYTDIKEFFQKNKDKPLYFVTTKAQKSYTDLKISDGDYFLFGKETKGLPEDILAKNYENCIRIPMKKESRSLNLSNSAAIIVYEALRQIGFPGLITNGNPGKFGV